VTDAIIERLDTAPDNAFAFVRMEIRRIIDEHGKHLCSGACKDHSEYARFCGVIEGLSLAESELLDVQERLERA
tara:strand:+ start:359 stop:580 length:222 start_codon:yes stop_codon:yes gene_type:complete